MAMLVIDLDELKSNTIADLSKAILEAYLEACLICLDYHQHPSKTNFEVQLSMKADADSLKHYQLDWTTTLDDTTRRTWEDLQEATEFGAIAIALLLIFQLTDYKVVRRSRKGTHFDYWLAKKSNSTKLVFSEDAKLEISGILEENSTNTSANRVKLKIEQIKKSNLANPNLPSFVVVVEFSKPTAHIVEV